MFLRLSFVAAAVVAAVTCGILVRPAHATYPGDVGRLAFGMNVGGNFNIYTRPAERARPAAADDRPRLRRVRVLRSGRPQHRLLQRPQRCVRDLADGRERPRHAPGDAPERVRDVPGHLAGRQEDRVRRERRQRRPERRPLRLESRRQRRDAADVGRRQQRLPRVVAGRHEDRVHQRPHGRRAGVLDERERVRADAADEGRLHARPAPRLEPGRLEDRVRGRVHRQRRHLRHERGRLEPDPADDRRRRPSSGRRGRRMGSRSRSSASSRDAERVRDERGRERRCTPSARARTRRSCRPGSRSAGARDARGCCSHSSPPLASWRAPRPRARPCK